MNAINMHAEALRQLKEASSLGWLAAATQMHR